jgi:hypothetical protein
MLYFPPIKASFLKESLKIFTIKQIIFLVGAVAAKQGIPIAIKQTDIGNRDNCDQTAAVK